MGNILKSLFGKENEVEFVTAVNLQPQRGDMIEVNRGVYSHWMVYVGENPVRQVPEEQFDPSTEPSFGRYRTVLERQVVHFMAVEQNISCLIQGCMGRVIKESLQTAVQRDRCRVNNSQDRTISPRSPANVVATALYLCDHRDEHRYHLLFRNCEHFATFCRYNIGVSDQVQVQNILQRL